jgi:hypothetical protein
MVLPREIVLFVGALVLTFGIYRIRIGFRSDSEDQKAKVRGGMYGFSRRTHVLIGVIYVLMGGALLLAGFGIDVLKLRR